MEDLGVTTGDFWRDRPNLVTGASGLVGGWLVKRLMEAGADVVCLVRDWVPQSELVSSKLIDRVKTARGDLRDQRLLERGLGAYEIDTDLHLAAQTIVPIPHRNPLSTFQTNVAAPRARHYARRRLPVEKPPPRPSSGKA